jgi:3-oxoacyl-[acyl-carrier protein] reductase
MADADLAGRRVILGGHAEDVLVEATRRAFEEAGCDVIEPSGSPRPPDHDADVVVVFARRPSHVPIIETDDEVLADDLERQLLAPRRLAIAAARSMARGSGGAIVLVGSIDAFHAYPGRSTAAVAMGGLLGLTRALAVEIAASGVRANLVVAGPLGIEDGSAPPGTDASALERTLLRSPSHRLAKPSEVAAAIRFVAGPDAAFMTGQTLRVDGGWASLNQAPEGMRFP